MTEDSRPPDWDWVKATHQCRAEAMFGELKALARRDVHTRNEQLKREVFKFTEISGLEFVVGARRTDTVYFKVTDDLARISVSSELNRERTVYTVGLDINGICKFRRADDDGTYELDAWQVLKAALETLFFSGGVSTTT